jgi:hypothetical protein
MIIVARFLQKVKDGILEITGYDAFCPVCGEPLHFHGRCRRFVRTQTWEQRIEMSIRVLYCMSCCRFHRELPDFLAPFKHFSLEMVANIYDGIVKSRLLMAARSFVSTSTTALSTAPTGCTSQAAICSKVWKPRTPTKQKATTEGKVNTIPTVVVFGKRQPPPALVYAGFETAAARTLKVLP